MNKVIAIPVGLFTLARDTVNHWISSLFQGKSRLSQTISDVCTYDRFIDSSEVKMSSSCSLEEVCREIKNLSDYQKNLNACVSEMVYSISCMESMMCELNSGMEDVLQKSYESSHNLDNMSRNRSRILFDDEVGTLWFRLRNVRNYLSDVLLNYNERISRTDLSMTRVVECERLAEMICELFQDEMQDTYDDDDFTDEHELHVEFVRYEEEDLPF